MSVNVISCLIYIYTTSLTGNYLLFPNGAMFYSRTLNSNYLLLQLMKFISVCKAISFKYTKNTNNTNNNYDNNNSKNNVVVLVEVIIVIIAPPTPI